jgi:co-chaperonin GroES (HSP10)
MGLIVKGHRVLIKPDPLKKRVETPETLEEKGFEVVLPADLERREEAGTQIGTVIQVGNTAFKAFDGNDPYWEPWCKVGDRVLFTRYSGKIIEDPVTKEKFMVVNDEDIQAILTGELPDIGEVEG